MIEYAGTASTVGGAGASWGEGSLEDYAPYFGGLVVVLVVLFFALRR